MFILINLARWLCRLAMLFPYSEDPKANKIHTPDLCPGFQEKLMRMGGLTFFYL